MTDRRDVATLAVVACLVLMLGWIAYVKVSEPRRDAWQPEELSGLHPPFPSPTNGVRKC